MLAVFGALVIAAAPPKPTLTDTLTATPWVHTVFAAWHPSINRAWCITSDARWTHFYYLRHLTPMPEIGCDGRPMLLQLPACPEFAPMPAPAYVVIQCGAGAFMVYARKPGAST